MTEGQERGVVIGKRGGRFGEAEEAEQRRGREYAV